MFDELKENGDILEDIGFTGRVQYALAIQSEITEMEAMGYYIYGMRRKVRISENQNFKNMVMDAASIVLVKQDNPSIVGNFLIAAFPRKVRFGP